MESSPPREVILPQTESVPLAEARFIDRLDREHETTWEDLRDAAQGMGGPIEDILTPVWRDEAVPQAFRDRALLVASAAKVMGALGVTRRCTHWGFGGNVESFERMVPDFDVEPFAAWYKDGLAYEREKGVTVFGEKKSYGLALELYEKDLFSDEELHELLTELLCPPAEPIEGMVPGYMQPLRAQTTLEAELMGDSNGEDYWPPTARTQAWALRQLNAWLAHERGDTVELPEWLQTVTAEDARGIYQDLARDVQYEHGKITRLNNISWQTLQPAIEHFGWSLVVNAESGSTNYAVDRIRTMGEDNQDMQLGALRYIIGQNPIEERKVWPVGQTELKVPLFSKEDGAFVEKVILASGDESLRDRMSQEQEIRRVYDRAQAKERERRSQEFAEEMAKDPKNIAKKRNKLRFERLLKVLKAVDISEAA